MTRRLHILLAHRKANPPSPRSWACCAIIRAGPSGCPLAAQSGRRSGRGSRLPGPEVPLLWVNAGTAGDLGRLMLDVDQEISGGFTGL